MREVQSETRYRFDGFTLDRRTGELWRQGTRVRLKLQPARVLTLLASRPGEFVPREAIQHEIWGEKPTTDTELGLNTCIRLIRAALHDSAERPRFIETLPRLGYRFIAPVEIVPASPPQPARPVRTTRLTPGLVAVLLAAALLLVAVVLVALRVTRAPGALRGPTLAVLPFANLTGDPAQEYLADGFTVELIGELGRAWPGRLTVIAATSSMAVKGSTEDAAAMGRRLGATLLIEGSVRRAGSRLRVNVQLVRARDQAQLWAGTVESDVDDALTAETEATAAVTGHVSSVLGLDTSSRSPATGTQSREAHEAYLKGKHHLRMLGLEAAEKAIVLFNQALAADPRYASAHQGLAVAFYALSNMRWKPAEAMAQAREAATRALELDPNLSAAHTSLGLIHAFYDWEWERAEGCFRRAIRLDPSSAQARACFGLYLALMGRLERATSELEEARRLDPLSPTVTSLRSLPPYLAGDYEESLGWAHQALDLQPGFFQAQTALGTTYEAMGDHARAVVELEKAYQLEDSPVILAFLGRARALAGDRQAARMTLEHLLELRRTTFVSPFEISLVHGGLGDHEQALDWLERAYEERAEGLAALKVNPRLDALRSEPRFRALLARMRFPN